MRYGHRLPTIPNDRRKAAGAGRSSRRAARSDPAHGDRSCGARGAWAVRTGTADRIVQAFDDFVAQPLAANLTKLHGRDLAKRNPMIYTARGVDSVEEWADQVLADKETSAIEAHIGTWLEEVARLVSGGIKPGSGVDLQITDADGVVQLYAIQSAPNTKNAGGRKSDIEALRRGARPLREQRQRVELERRRARRPGEDGVMRETPTSPCSARTTSGSGSAASPTSARGLCARRRSLPGS